MNKMGRTLKISAIFVLLLMLTFSLVGCGGNQNAENETTSETAQEELQKINVTFQPVYNGWAPYDAIKSGLDKDAGLELEMIFFDSGMPQIEAIPANAWEVGATGTIPGLMAGLRYDAYVVGVADDETFANTVMVRPDSPLLNTKGYNPQYPDVYGNPDDLRGKTILVPTVSSAHYVLACYLNAMGLTEEDVSILNMEPAQAVSAFESGEGDIVALWAPFIFTGAEKGWKYLCSGGELNAPNPNLLVVPKKVGDEQPELVAKFLKLFLEHQANLKNNETNMINEYVEYNKEWGGIDLSADFATQDMDKHVVFTIEDQMKMFDKTNGQSEIETTLAEIINFFGDQGKFTDEEREQLLKFEYVTDKFLKMALEQ